eukprot:5281627-Pleurochrysis_carterae.AAC.1
MPLVAVSSDTNTTIVNRLTAAYCYWPTNADINKNHRTHQPSPTPPGSPMSVRGDRQADVHQHS